MSNSESRRLESWKEISTHLKRTVRTVQRWERSEGLPVHRHVHQDQSSVYAFVEELDTWLQARSVSLREGTRGEGHGSDVRLIVRDAVLRGRFLLSTRTAEGLLAAVRSFQAAVAHDPTDPVGYAHLAEAYCALSGNEIWSPEDGFAKSRAAALQALSLDPHLAQAHASLGMVHNMYDWDWKRSEERFQAAIACDPGYAPAYHWRGLMFINSGRPREAQEPLQRAAELDPLSPAIAANMGRPLLFLGKYDEAITKFQKAFDLDCRFWMAHVFISWAHAACGRHEASIEAAGLAVNDADGISVPRVVLAEACARAGQAASAGDLLESTLADGSIRYLSPYRIARVHLGLGDVANAFEWLDRALLDRSLGSTTCLSHDPALESVRGDSRFARYLRALNIAESVGQ